MKTFIAELEQVYKKDSSGLVAEYLNDKGGVWHFHPEYEILLNLKNNGTRIIGNNVELFDEYDMVLIAGNVPHCWNYYKTGESLPENHSIVVHFPLNFFGNEFLNQHEMVKVRELFAEAEKGVAFSVQDAKTAEKILISMVSHSGIDKILDFFHLLKLMCNSTHRRQLSTENYKIGFERPANKIIAKVLSFIRENYNKHLTLKDVSNVADMKPFSFSKYFKKYTGTGFIEYLNQVRANRACYLLRETDTAIHDIVKDCGFFSVSNFNKQFKKIMGISPRSYRAQFRNI